MIVFYFWVPKFWQIVHSIFNISVAISLKTLDFNKIFFKEIFF